jgi:hypothetical protein
MCPHQPPVHLQVIGRHDVSLAVEKQTTTAECGKLRRYLSKKYTPFTLTS